MCSLEPNWISVLKEAIYKTENMTVLSWLEFLRATLEYYLAQMYVAMSNNFFQTK